MLHTIGLVVRIFGALLIAPLMVDLLYGNREEAIGFAIAGVSAAVIGEIMRRMDRHKTDLSRIEGLAVVAFSWLVVSMFAAIPYLWSGLGFVDAAFESMSGLTTTG
ncbi:MAG: TrkH family potassium uptake protein, partial [Acidobacteriota bacterium]